MKFDLNVTFSKFIAFVIIILAFSLDIKSNTVGTVFMFALPFVNVIITGKQFLDQKTEGRKHD
jgi:hypothetical protein